MFVQAGGRITFGGLTETVPNVKLAKRTREVLPTLNMPRRKRTMDTEAETDELTMLRRKTLPRMQRRNCRSSLRPPKSSWTSRTEN